MESSSVAKAKNDKAWRNVSEEIKRLFRAAVLQLQEKGTMKSAEAKKFLCSGGCPPPPPPPPAGCWRNISQCFGGDR